MKSPDVPDPKPAPLPPTMADANKDQSGTKKRTRRKQATLLTGSRGAEKGRTNRRTLLGGSS